MKIWVDADACPVAIREILFRAARRTGISLTLVANQAISIPPGGAVEMLQVPKGFDVADNEIVKRINEGDLVVTQDIPLAAEVIAKQGLALSPRGELFTKNNIAARLNMRDFMETMRSSGIHSGGPAALNQSDKKQFAAALDAWLAKQSRNTQSRNTQ